MIDARLQGGEFVANVAHLGLKHARGVVVNEGVHVSPADDRLSACDRPRKEDIEMLSVRRLGDGKCGGKNGQRNYEFVECS